MKAAIREILEEFYAKGLPDGIYPREQSYSEVRGHATVVLGMRRTGKTYFAFSKMRELMSKGVPIKRMVYINFDDARLAGLTVGDLRHVCDVHAELFPEVASEVCWYFLDELQDVKGWELFARRLLDSPNVRLCLTGSSARLLSRDVATSMRGRSLEIEIFPLSFLEYLTCNGIFKECPRLVNAPNVRGKLRKAYADYLRTGGFPSVQGLDDKLRIGLLQEYAQAVVYRDVIERYEVRSIQSLQCVMQYLLHNFARNVSVRAIAGVLKQQGIVCRRETLADYISYFQDAYFSFGVSRHTDSFAVRRVNPDKCYLIDTGLIQAMKPKNDAERGWLLENLVFLGLRRGFNKIEYYITRSGREIDFIVRCEATKEERLVQVCYDMSLPGTKERELAALREARAETGIDDCVIVTDDEDRVTDDAIEIMSAWKWLLREESKGIK